MADIARLLWFVSAIDTIDNHTLDFLYGPDTAKKWRHPGLVRENRIDPGRNASTCT